MNKRLFLFIGAILTCVALFLLRFTTMPGHIAISVVATVVLIFYTIADKKNWKIPVLEYVSRISFGIAMISGIVMKAGVYNSGISVAHKLTAGLYLLLIIITFAINSKKKTN